MKSQQHRALYSMIVGVLALLLFLYGFFPMKRYDTSPVFEDDFPSVIEDVRVNVNSSYKSLVGRLVIMIIDAFRVDFISGHEGSLNMPYTASLIQNHQACLLTAKSNPPTVTMPRIKALTTGTVPNFVDVIFNFGSNEITEDSIIHQALRHGKRVTFYGDDTWLKLFPKSFIRSEGTTSFFVTDFTEVDDNVTRHLKNELSNQDWQVMILHYLGLDHIGHIEGPKSSLIRPKLQEMDVIIQRIHQRLSEQEGSSESAVLFVCGDHGMKDSGGHGGASLAEILIPLIVTGYHCPTYSRVEEEEQDKVVAQIDIVPTLAMLLGIPIPRNNIGRIIPVFLRKLPLERQLYFLFYNALQIAHQFENSHLLHSQVSPNSYQQFKEAVKLHGKWLKIGSGVESDLPDKIIELYTKAMEGMSTALSDSMVKYDVYLMAVAVWISWQAVQLLTLIPTQEKLDISIVCTGTLVLSTFCFIGNLMYCWYSRSDSLLCTNTLSASIVLCVVIFLTAGNTFLLLYSYIIGNVQIIRFQHSQLLVLGSGLQVVSLASSSFIEEEHQVWYFLWVTLMLIIIHNLIKKQKMRHTDSKLIWQSLGNLFLHRLFRKWNQTGDKWASLPDIGDWLMQPKNKCYMSFIFLLGLLGVLWSCYYINRMYSHQKEASSIPNAILLFICATCIYCYRTAIGNVILPFFYPQSRGAREVHIFWFTIGALLAKHILSAIAHHGNINWRNSTKSLCQLLSGLVKCWLLLCALLHRPHNVILLAAQVWVTKNMNNVHKVNDIKQTCWLTIVHIWIGMIFFFYQGNSNSLASVDVAAGYVGHEGYNPVTVGILLIANTYSSPILSFLLLVVELTQDSIEKNKQEFQEQLGTAYCVMSFMRLIVVSVYTALLIVQRYHLFVWTVFSPKLLYESVYTVLQFALLLSTYIFTGTSPRRYTIPN